MHPLDAHLEPTELERLQRFAEVAARELAPVAAAGTRGRVNRALVRALAEHGVLAELYRRDGDGAWAPVSATALCLTREGLARGSTDAETAFALQGLGAYPILQSARPEVAEHWIPRVAAGEAVAAFALSEPDAGSDVSRVALQAERDGDGFRLTGEKTWISNAPDADVYTVFARTTPGAGARGLTAFVVPGDSEGLGGEALTMVSDHPIGRLVFDGVHVPSDYVLGEMDRGFRVAMQTLDLFRPSVGAFAAGMGRAALDAAVEHADARELFAGRLRDLQAVTHRIADVAARLHAARGAVYAAAGAYDRGVRPITALAAMGKLLATEVAQEAIDVAIQVHGARGLEHGHVLEHLYRDVRATRIYEGASEVQRELIGRALFEGRS